VKNVPSFRTRLPLIWPLGNFDTTFAAKGLGECPTLVQTVSSVCCMRAYDCQRRLFHKLFNIFVEKTRKSQCKWRFSGIRREKISHFRVFDTPGVDLSHSTALLFLTPRLAQC